MRRDQRAFLSAMPHDHYAFQTRHNMRYFGLIVLVVAAAGCTAVTGSNCKVGSPDCSVDSGVLCSCDAGGCDCAGSPSQDAGGCACSGNCPLTCNNDAGPAIPTVQNTGIPMGLSQGTSTFAFLGEGLTDSRPTESLAAATPTNSGITVPDASGLSYLPNTATHQTFDHLDFTNIKLVVPAAVLSVTFTKCWFRATNPAFSANWAAGAMLVQVLGASTAVTFKDCNLDGSLPDPNFAVQNFLSSPSGNTSGGGITMLRNNIRGFSTALSIGAFSTFLFDSNYVHDLVINKSADVPPYTNSGVWAHIDGCQIGATNTVGTGRVVNNNLIAWSAINQISSGPLQVGQMAGPAPASILDVVFDGNYMDGASYMVGANTNTAISVTTRFELINTKFGLNYAYGIDGANTIHSIATRWAGNTYYKSGMAGTNRPIAVTAGQAVP